jgi:hypothetical protein
VRDILVQIGRTTRTSRKIAKGVPVGLNLTGRCLSVGDARGGSEGCDSINRSRDLLSQAISVCISTEAVNKERAIPDRNAERTSDKEPRTMVGQMWVS